MLSRLEPKHWALVASFITSTALVVGGLDHWADILKPTIVAGLLAQLATLLGAVFAGAPPNPNVTALNNPGRRDSDPTPPAMGNVSEATRRTL